MEQISALLNVFTNLSIEYLALVVVGIALVVVILSLQIVGKLVANKLKDGQ